MAGAQLMCLCHRFGVLLLWRNRRVGRGNLLSPFCAHIAAVSLIFYSISITIDILNFQTSCKHLVIQPPALIHEPCSIYNALLTSCMLIFSLFLLSLHSVHPGEVLRFWNPYAFYGAVSLYANLSSGIQRVKQNPPYPSNVSLPPLCPRTNGTVAKGRVSLATLLIQTTAL